MTGGDANHLHAFFLPYFTTSHIIPLVDTARLFASRGVRVTIATTPANALLFRSSVDGDPNITVRLLTFPSAEVGLPAGVENFSGATTLEMTEKLGDGINMLRRPMEAMIRESGTHCIVSDMYYPWTVELAKELGIPRLVLHASNCFNHCVAHSLDTHSPHTKVESDSEDFLIPGLPDKITMKRSELEDHRKTTTQYGRFMEMIKASEKQSYGLILTSYREFEPAYVDHFNTVVGQRCWLVGLPAQVLDHRHKVGGENCNSIERHNILSWLDGHKPNTVLYVCFGSMIRFTYAQLKEIALALEGSGRPFIWVVRGQGETGEDFFPEGFEERIKGRNTGLIVRDWAPQTAILEHVAVGGFMTHCGWNSLVESITAGVPLVTWPLFAEQFYNEKLITQVMKIGVGVGSHVWNYKFVIRSPVVEKDKIVKAVDSLMGGSDEAGDIRARAKEFSLMAKEAVGEGGSACRELDRLIEEIKSDGSKK